jgi:hypothetical protein
MRYHHAVLFSLLLSIGLVACDQKESSEEAGNGLKQEEVSTQGTAIPKQSPVEQVAVQDAEGNTVFEIKFDQNGGFTLKVDNNRTIEARAKSREKRIYSTDGYDFIEVKAYEDGKFKLKTTNGQLLWKVKLYDDKVKISDNEENENPYEIKRKESGKIKVYHQGKEICEAVQKGEQVVVKVGDKEVLRIPAKQNSMGYAILGVQQIPFDERYVLMAELLTRGL